MYKFSSLLLAAASLASLASASSIVLAPRSVPENYYNGSIYGVGCYKDDNAFYGVPQTAGTVRDSYASDNMSNEACSNYCGDRGFKYSGTEWARECYCSNTAPGAAAAARDQCTFQCSGAPTERCGNGLILTVWANAGVRKTVSKYNAKVSGCFTDEAGKGKARTFNNGYLAGTNMTQEYCANFCGDKDYRYAGIEYGRECMCSNDAPTITDGATCDMTCTGDSTQQCGGTWAMTVIENTSIQGNPTTVNGNVALGTSYTSKGCFADFVGNKGRTLSAYSFTDSVMTVEKCAAACSAKKYAFSATEFGSECYCGSIPPAVASTSCNVPCAGNKREICGGPNALTVYQDTTQAVGDVSTCSNLPAGYVPCLEGQKVVNGACVSALSVSL